MQQVLVVIHHQDHHGNILLEVVAKLDVDLKLHPKKPPKRYALIAVIPTCMLLITRYMLVCISGSQISVIISDSSSVAQQTDAACFYLICNYNYMHAMWFIVCQTSITGSFSGCSEHF
jgi:hypothetical protein